MYTYSIIITRNGQEIKKFLDFLPVLSIYFSIECQLLLEVKNVLYAKCIIRGGNLWKSTKGVRRKQMDAKCTCIDGKQTGQRILDYMQKQGLSVNGLARMLEVTPNAVRNYIRGHNRPSVEKMYQICKIFSVDIRDIIVERRPEERTAASEEGVRTNIQ